MALTKLEAEMTVALIRCQTIMLKLFPNIDWAKVKKKLRADEILLINGTPEVVTVALVHSSQVAVARERWTDPQKEPPEYLLRLRGYYYVWPEKAINFAVQIMGEPYYHFILGYWVFPCENLAGDKRNIPVADIDPTTAFYP